MKKKALVMLLAGAMLVMGGCGSAKVENTGAVNDTAVEEAESVEPTAEDGQTEEVTESDVTTLPLEDEEFPVDTGIPADAVSAAIDNFHNHNRVIITGNVVKYIFADDLLPGGIFCNRATGIEYMYASDGENELESFFDKKTSTEYYGSAAGDWLKVIPDTETEAESALVDTLLAPYIDTADSFEVVETQDENGASYYRATSNYVDEASDKYLVVINITEEELLPFELSVYEVQDDATVTDENFENPITSFEISYNPADDTTFDEVTTLPEDEICTVFTHADVEALMSLSDE